MPLSAADKKKLIRLMKEAQKRGMKPEDVFNGETSSSGSSRSASPKSEKAKPKSSSKDEKEKAPLKKVAALKGAKKNMEEKMSY
jgi:hypothetical protein